MRSSEAGYVLAAMNDPSGRRGIWYRQTDRNTPLEICGGREGDDAYVKMTIGEAITPRMLFEVEDILSRGAWMVDEQKAQAARDRYAAMSDEEKGVEDARLTAEPDRVAEAGQAVEAVVGAYLDDANGV